MEDHASLLAANQQAQRDVAERNEEIDKMAGRIRELEQALLNSADNNRAISELEQELHKTRLREQELTQVRTDVNLNSDSGLISSLVFFPKSFFSSSG